MAKQRHGTRAPEICCAWPGSSSASTAMVRTTASPHLCHRHKNQMCCDSVTGNTCIGLRKILEQLVNEWCRVCGLPMMMKTAKRVCSNAQSI